jgi:hypothetical protein
MTGAAGLVAGMLMHELPPPKSIATYHGDPRRSGQYVAPHLTWSRAQNLRVDTNFRPNFSGHVHAQPLFWTIPGTSRSLIIVATEENVVYAFDSMSGRTVWKHTLGPAVQKGELKCGDIFPLGVTGTPVIDPASGLLYVVSKSVSAGKNVFYQRLHAINITTGGEAPGSPATISGSYPGTGDGGTVVSFNPQTQNQRPGLALINGIVYVAWAAHEDTPPYHGWLMGYSYSGASFKQTALFNAVPNSSGGGIWMGNAAPASDSSGNLYVVSGNGSFDVTSSVSPNNDYGDSLLQLSGALSVKQYFTPSDQAADDSGDHDFGAGGAALLADLPSGSPVPHLLLCGGKDGTLYIVNRDALGGFGDNFAVQKIPFSYQIYATGAYWNSRVYLAGSGGPLAAYTVAPSVPSLDLAASSSHVYNFPGGSPSVSASGTQNGIVWVLDTSQYCTAQAPGCGPAVLYAYDATNVGSVLWNSAELAADAAGHAVKFTVPTIANGKVYVGTRGNNTGGVLGSTSAAGELDVYGLAPN